MYDLSQYKISSDGLLSQKLIDKDITDLLLLSEWLRHLPYRRISDSELISLVIDESCGTCSSKHILFCSVALENGYDDFELIVGIYSMNQMNTPGIGTVIKDNYLDYIPEAHCYIRYGAEIIDVTKPISIYHSIKDDLLEETVMMPSQVLSTKTSLHRSFINRWRVKNMINKSEDELWAIRERCINNLVNEN